MAVFSLHAFGPARLERDGQPVAFDRNKALALLVYLAVTESEHSRQSLAALFWPEYEPSKAYAYLRRTLWALGEALQVGWLEAGREHVRLVTHSAFEFDVARFRGLLRATTLHGHPAENACPECLPLLSQAISLYQADFLAGFSLKDSPQFDDWQVQQAENLRQEMRRALERLANLYLELGQPQEAQLTAQRYVNLDPLDESAHRLLMRAYAQAGQRSAALRQFQECARLLKAELGVAPQPETKELYERIRQGKLAPQPEPTPIQPIPGPPPGASPAALEAVPVYNLPAQPTPFIGRQAELDEVLRLLEDPTCRLLSLTGPGGIGKTRLAIESGRRAAERMPGQLNGIYFVMLAPLATVDLMAQHIGAALRLAFRADNRQPKQQLLDFLREKQVLLVLDNFEHLLAGADLLTEILEAAPGIKLLVTSRVRLNLASEWALPVQGMSFPRDEWIRPLEEFGAVQLFLNSARRANAAFTPKEADLPAIAHICQMVDGMPLGIELAAAWVRMFSCQEIALQISKNLDFLTSSLRGLPERHQSLRAVFEHSWALLPEPAQVALRRLSVFQNDFALEAAEALLAGDLSVPALSLLSTLVDQSILHVSQTGRYSIHQLLKQYAAEKLEQAAGEKELASQRHAAHFAATLAQKTPELFCDDQLVTRNQIEAMLDDVRRAFQWALQHDQEEQLERMAKGLGFFYEMSNRHQEGEEIFGQAARRLRARLEGAPEPRRAARLAFLLRELAVFITNQGQYQRATPIFMESFDLVKAVSASPPEAQPEGWRHQRAMLLTLLHFGDPEVEAGEVRRLFEECVQVFRDENEQWLLAYACLNISSTHAMLPEAALGQQLRADALAIFETLGDRWGMIHTLNAQARSHYSLGEYAEAEACSLRSLELCVEFGDHWRQIFCLLTLGEVTLAMGQNDKAEAYWQDGLKRVQQTGNRSITAAFLDGLGYLRFLAGDGQAAEQKYRQSLQLNRLDQNPEGECMALLNLGDLARRREDYSQARELYEEAQRLLEPRHFAWYIILAHKKLGSLLSATGEMESAWEHYRQAMEIARPASMVPEVLEVTIEMADWFNRSGQPDLALALLDQVVAHPKALLPSKKRAEELLQRVQADHPEAQAGGGENEPAESLETLLDQLLQNPKE